ncbi:hypothetical protein PSOS111911_13715 [Pseudoalteromonas ostreae]|nr:hypothetical protein [Pseudoalteromonas ostreae]
MPALFFQQQLVITKHSVQPFKLHSCLSHSNGFVGAALNVERIEFGFDIEKINLKRPFAKLAKHFYHLDEVNLTALSCQYHEFDISVVSDKSTDWQCSVVNSPPNYAAF